MQLENIIGKQLYEKYQELGENLNTHLEGVYHAKPITYWDYIEVDTLLSLQRPRTGFEDEMIFILYHQVSKLVMKMMLHEIKQVSGNALVDASLLEDKINRLNRYTGTAKHYLDAQGEEKTATGGSQWKKYLHPKYQQRKFFPGLWSAVEIANWGEEIIN